MYYIENEFFLFILIWISECWILMDLILNFISPVSFDWAKKNTLNLKHGSYLDALYTGYSLLRLCTDTNWHGKMCQIQIKLCMICSQLIIIDYGQNKDRYGQQCESRMQVDLFMIYGCLSYMLNLQII